MREEIDRGASWLAALYLTSRVQLHQWYRLAYDSLQHTSYVFLSDLAAKPPPVAKGACAFFGSLKKRVLTVSWEEKTWSPQIAGFLIDAN
jgi:hypothetical protein